MHPPATLINEKESFMSNNYRNNSIWTDELELKCFLIFKQAEEQKFKYGLVAELCRKLAQKENLDEGTLKAKVGNYKSLAGYTRPTNASTATKRIFKQYKHLSKEVVEALLEK